MGEQPAGAEVVAPDVRAALVRLGLASSAEDVALTPLTGGVSSDIWRVDTPRGVWCLKRALAKLKVKQDWQAPIARSRHEYAWIRTVGALVPSAAPELAGYDDEAGIIAMRYYPSEQYPLWKAQLAAGTADAAFAARVGDTLGRVHAATAHDDGLAKVFDTGDTFYAIRLEPYLVATGRAHADLAGPLAAIVSQTAATRLALVHGDVSPKNILVGPGGPMFLDAECAWYGDPAFDLAFCLNHMLLKCLWVSTAAGQFLACFAALADSYLSHVRWEDTGSLEARAARLLPALFLARVDGKSPVEYITAEADRDRVRRVARSLIAAPVSRLSAVSAAWRKELSG